MILPILKFLLVFSFLYTKLESADINISSYPLPLQQLYPLLDDRCSTCHSMRRTTCAKEILPSDWEDTLHRMAKLPNANLNQRDIASLYDFLVYDSAVRRKSALNQQLNRLSMSERTVEQTKINEVLNKYR